MIDEWSPNLRWRLRAWRRNRRWSKYWREQNDRNHTVWARRLVEDV